MPASLTRDEAPDSLTSEGVLQRGVWRERAAEQQRGLSGTEPAALEWSPHVSLTQRIARAVSVPAVAGTCVFVVAVVTAIIMTMMQFQEPRDVSVVQDTQETRSTRAADDPHSPEEASLDSPGVSPADATPGVLTVHVVGEVVQPGVIEVPVNTRVAEAIEVAGGATDAAVLEALNLARVVTDGEQIVVPDAAGVVPVLPGESSASLPAMVNLNTADASALESLPRIGPALAQRIIAWREANGGFTSPTQLLEVPGVGEKTFEGLRSEVTV